MNILLRDRYHFPKLWLLLIFAAPGCLSKTTVMRYDLKGEVTYAGKPVPAGYIMFTPDRSRNNAGPSTQAEIVNGHFETISEQGVIGGPHVVKIVGTNGVPMTNARGKRNPRGKYLFTPFQTDVNLPRANGIFNFTVPEKSN